MKILARKIYRLVVDRGRLPVEDEHIRIRRSVVVSHARQAEFDVAVLGDSLVEACELSAALGAGVLNGGMAGAKLADVHRLLGDMLRICAVGTIVMAVGVNDAARSEPTDPDAFEQRLRQMAAEIRSAGRRPWHALIAPIGEGPAGRAHFDPAHIRRLNERIAAVAGSAALIDLQTALADERGCLRAEHTLDGAHLTPLGYEAWGRALQVCRQGGAPAAGAGGPPPG